MIDIRTTPAPIETVTPIRASEAIRLGCLIAPIQAFGRYGNGQMACALGAMVIGLGDHKFGYALGDGPGLAFAEQADNFSCPTGCADFEEDHLIGHLNDDHEWSRERIADWLEGLGL